MYFFSIFLRSLLLICETPSGKDVAGKKKTWYSIYASTFETAGDDITLLNCSDFLRRTCTCVAEEPFGVM